MGSVEEAAGSSGGAAGSSQSPSWEAGSLNRVSVPNTDVTPSTQARMLGYWRRRRPTSPKRSYSAHGTSTAASPQPAYGTTSPNGQLESTHGTKTGTIPSGVWSAARSLSHEARKPAQSNR